jgi:nucleoside-diphosphate-sugar epimerase
MANPTLLILGGSGFVSGTLARRALAQGHQVWTVTRGQRALPDGVTPIVVDRRDREAFARAIADLDRSWDFVVDCIGYEPDDARQDIEVFRTRTNHLVFISTDFVFDPAKRRFPQAEVGDYVSGGYGGKKRLCEEVLEQADSGSMAWTVVRPCHIYGPGSQLGCLPRHSRDPELISKLQAGQPLELVGGGRFLQHPILARDLADLLLSVHGQAHTHGQIYLAAGPEYVESRTYYAIIADLLGVELRVVEVPIDAHLAAHPEAAPFLCHRLYDLHKLHASGLAVPSTPLEQGLREHVDSMKG